MLYLPRKFPRTMLAAVAALVGAGAAPAVAGAAQSPHASSSYVYVDDNTTGHNTIAAFARDADGTLAPVAGSPFDAGGAGTGSGLASQGAIQVSSDGRYVISVDPGSNQVSVLRIRHDGALRLVSVISSGGVNPVSVAIHGALVYVANAGAGGSNYTGFTLNRGGRLEPLADSTFVLPDSAQPGDVLFNATGSDLVGTRVGTSQIDSFNVGSDGRLSAAAGSPFAAQSAGPFGSEFRPTDASQLFVSNAHAGAGNGTVSAFSVASDGSLSAIGTSPFADQQTAPCWVEITADGQFLFTVNTASGSISRYSIAADGTLNLLGSTPVSDQSGVGAVDARLSTDGQTLFVNESRVAALGEFAVDGGQLTELGSVSLPAGATPAGVAVR
jgi:6-phosphogluconolactonase